MKKNEIEENDEDIIRIDYPEPNEEISIGTGYTIRVYATQCETVEISVNDGKWQPCRNSCGYWWYDWDEIEPGTYRIHARMFKSSGEIIVSKGRICKMANNFF